jgi:hypothetical protein
VNGEPEFISLQCPQGLHWVKDADQVIVVDEERNIPIVLTGIEVPIWEWLTLEYPYSKLLKLTTLLLETKTEEAAAEKLSTIMHNWQTLGLLETSEASNG